MTQKVTQSEATFVLNAVKKKHKQWLELSLEFSPEQSTAPVLRKWPDLGEHAWVIYWPEGPDEWAIRFHEPTPGLICEAYLSYILTINKE